MKRDTAACPAPSARDDFPRVAFHATPIVGIPSDIFEKDCAAALDEIDRLRVEVARLTGLVNTDSPVSP